jgi:membrane-associated phospholipid phosphatase
MVNNAHWLSDVLVGAGIGILVTKLVYHFEPFKKFNPFKKSKNITFIPQIKERSYGFYFAYQL